MVGLAASAVSMGADVYRLGKLDSADAVRFEQRVDAVRSAAGELGLLVVKESLDARKGEWRCTLADDRKSNAKVFVQRRTETLCRTRINVGIFGSEPTARLILARVRIRERRDRAGTDTIAPDCTCPSAYGEPSDGAFDRPANFALSRRVSSGDQSGGSVTAIHASM
jgi:hypothetical protein